MTSPLAVPGGVRSARDTVLVLACEQDFHADLVGKELGRRGTPVVRCDPAEFPRGWTVEGAWDGSGWRGAILGAHGTLCTTRIRSVWVREPAALRPAAGPDPGDPAAAERAALGGLLRALDVQWVNHPDRLAVAEYRPVQLAVAARLGFAVPPTLVTGDVARAREFCAAHRRVVHRPVRDGGPDRPGGTPAGAAGRDGAGLPPRASGALWLLQEDVPGAGELHVVVMGERLFAVEGRSAPEAGERGGLQYGVTLPDTGLERAARGLLRELGLAFGVLHLRIRPDGGYVFLGLDGNAQWSRLEDQTGLPLCESMADLLAGRPERGRYRPGIRAVPG